MDREDKTRLELRCEADVPEHGYKFHMNDINATIGLANLRTVAERVDRARDNAAFYDCELIRAGVRKVERVLYAAGRVSSYWLYNVLVDDPARFIPFMKSRGVHASQVHVRNDVHSCFAASRAPLPGVDEFTRHQVSIPVGAWVTDDDRETVMNAIKSYEVL
jgi:dTDP-4-amino-4,6-dideoxygalactose transaminase